MFVQAGNLNRIIILLDYTKRKSVESNQLFKTFMFDLIENFDIEKLTMS